MSLHAVFQEAVAGTQIYPSGKSPCVKKCNFQGFSLETDQSLKATSFT